MTTSPTCSLYNIVVFPAPSNPKISTLNSLEPNSPPKMREKKPPKRQENLNNVYINTNNELQLEKIDQKLVLISHQPSNEDWLFSWLLIACDKSLAKFCNNQNQFKFFPQVAMKSLILHQKDNLC